MHQDCGVSSVANWDTLSSFIEQGKTAMKGWSVAHLYKTKEVRNINSMVMVIIGDLLLKDMLVKTLRGRSSIPFVEGGMHRVNVGLKVIITGVVIVEEIIL